MALNYYENGSKTDFQLYTYTGTHIRTEGDTPHTIHIASLCIQLDLYYNRDSHLNTYTGTHVRTEGNTPHNTFMRTRSQTCHLYNNGDFYLDTYTGTHVQTHIYGHTYTGTHIQVHMYRHIYRHTYTGTLLRTSRTIVREMCVGKWDRLHEQSHTRTHACMKSLLPWHVSISAYTH